MQLSQFANVSSLLYLQIYTYPLKEPLTFTYVHLFIESIDQVSPLAAVFAVLSSLLVSSSRQNRKSGV